MTDQRKRAANKAWNEFNRRNNYRGSGVDQETYESYAREYGGIPEFDRHGNYIGSRLGPFDNTQHQDQDNQP